MNILLDTNILIPLEDTGSPLSQELAELKLYSSELKYNLFYHKSQLEDIQRDKNEMRRTIVESRWNQYRELPSPPIPNDAEIQKLGWREIKANDRIDNHLLFALLRNSCHILVTNDEGIHTKAANSKIGDRVLRSSQFVAFLKRQRDSRIPKDLPYGIVLKYLHEFDLADSFFNSLRPTYEGFDSWYNKCAQEQRQAWCLINGENKLNGICIFKEESNPKIADENPPINGKALKLCTFKIGEELRGRKFGERMLYTAFKYAFENNYDWIYLHTRGPEQKKLTALCLEYGFEKIGKYKMGKDIDDVFLKPMRPSSTIKTSAIDYAKKFYPHYLDSDDIQKFLVPIRKGFHDQIFPDLMEYTLFKDDPAFYTPQSNTIKKAYLCNSKIQRMRVGDLVVFYKTQEDQGATCIGIIEEAKHISDVSEIMSLVAKRTVYSQKEIQDMLSTSGSILVILFRLLRYFPKTISREKLTSAGILGPIQSIRTISSQSFNTLKSYI